MGVRIRGLFEIPARKIVTERNNIYYGKVVTPFRSFTKMPDGLRNGTFNGDTFVLKSNVLLSNFERNIIFSIDQNNCANDLLFTSPSYPIITPNNMGNINKPIIICNAFNMKLILEYLRFPEMLGKKDIIKIVEIFMKSNTFVVENHQLFGLTENDLLIEKLSTIIDDDTHDSKVEVIEEETQETIDENPFSKRTFGILYNASSSYIEPSSKEKKYHHFKAKIKVA